MSRLGAVLTLLSVLSSVVSQSGNYGQCGGIGWTGPTTCNSGWVCVVSNDYYSQCLPGSSSTVSTTASRPTSSPVPTSTTSRVSTTTSATSSASTPSASVPVSSSWAAALSKAKVAVAKLTLEQKVSLGTGIGWQKGPCVGNTAAISSINFPGLCLDDSPVGVRYGDLVSVFPAGINVAATFNRDLMRQRGAALGAEFKGKGVNVALGPDMNLARTPTAGRNWEGFGGDPYLSGEAAFETITGMQSSGVQACAKHYINNEQEHFRDSSSSNVDDRTQHELYAAPFLRAVQAGVAAFMCSYNQINGTYACENDKMLNGVLKNELGFPGYVMSDWWGTHSTSPAVNAGLDMTMPGDISANSGTTFVTTYNYFGATLISAVNQGQVPQSRIDDMATRILAGWYLLGQDSGYPAPNFNAWNSGAGQHVNVQGNHGTLIRQIGAASVVLLKNTNGALPFKFPKSIGVIGNPAGPGSKGPNGYSDRGGLDGVLGVGWGSGTADFPYLITPVDAITKRAGTGVTVTSSLSDTDLNGAASAASGKDAAVVVIAADSGEGYITVEGNAGDRNDMKAWHGGDALVAQVARVNRNTIVVVNSVGPIIMEPWVTNPNVTAVVLLGAPGQEAGNALVDVLFGDVSPSGRLPYTIAKQQSDYPAQVVTQQQGSITPIPYSEGLFIDYRHFDQANIAPRYEFGFGLSYATFSYSGLSIIGSTAGGTRPTGPGSSTSSWLHDSIITVTFTLNNNGSIAGTEIPQLYLSPPVSAKTAPFLLKGFDSIQLDAGASEQVSFGLSRYDLSTWDVQSQQWEVATGTTGVSVGASSRDHRLSGSIVL